MKQDRRLPRLLREKTSERVYPKTIMVAALTAITLAFISAKLAGVVNSLVLVAMASVLTAIIGEAYRLVIETTQTTLARAVARSLDEQAEALTGEIPAVSLEEVLAHGQERNEAGSQPPATHEDVSNRSLPWLFLHRLFVSRWAVPFVFGVVALATVGGSYLMGQVNGAPSYNVVKEVTNTRDISSSKVDRLEKSAEEAAQEAAEAEADTAEANAEATTAETREELLTRIEQLEASLAQAQGSIADLRTAGNDTSDLEALLTGLSLRVAKLTLRVEELEVAEPPPEEPVPTTP